MSYTIEMLWECSTCDSKDNRGLDRFCPSCGKPKEDKDREYFPKDISRANALTGEKDRLARAGADWKCKYCSVLQASPNAYCSRCGSSKRDGTKWKANPKSEVTKSGASVTIPRPSKAKASKAKATITGVLADIEETPPPVFADDPLEWERPSLTPVARTIQRVKGYPWEKKHLLLLLIPILPILLYLLFRTREVDVDVRSSSWTHTVVIDRYHVVAEEGWYPSSGAMDTKPLGQRVHHYDHVAVGSHQESYTENVQCGQTCTTVPGVCRTSPPTCTSNRNGTASCSGGGTTCSSSTQSCSPKYCTVARTRTVTDYQDQPRYQMWYGWNEWEWTNGFRKVTRSGVLDPYWPTPQEVEMVLPPGEQERSHSEESYLVTFTDGKAEWKFHPAKEGEYLRLVARKRHRLRVSIAGPTEVIE